MKHMFTSATIKLTAWYLGIIMLITISFSYIIFQISVSEANARISVFQTRIQAYSPPSDTDAIIFPDFRSRQIHETENTLFIGLLYANISIFIIGGIGSYWLARRTLKPIEVSHEAQSRFTSDASHELRTPLAVMKSELEVALRDKKLSKSEMRQILESNLEEVNRLSDLSRTLLQLSKQEFSDDEKRKLNIIDAIEKAIHTHGVEKERIKTHFDKKSFLTLANESSLRELFVILLDNALRYSPPKSIINLYASETGSKLAISIQNSGEGIKKVDIEKVFDRFYRGDKSRTSQNGTSYGLGLSLAKKIVDIHGGSIEISSEPGKITSVNLEFTKY